MTQPQDDHSGPVLFSMCGEHIAVVTLNRPAARNAINSDVASAIDSLVDRTEADSHVRAVVLASSHVTVFCAGADLSEFARGNAAALSTAKGFGGFADAVRRKPWIAAVDGAALAGGCELALACDIVVGSTRALFGLPEVKRGLIAGAGGTCRLPRALPRSVALEMIITGDPIDATRAYDLGLITRLTPGGGALAEALVIAENIAANSPMAVRESLHVARRALENDEAELKSISDAAVRRVFASEDALEGARAFLEKRAPRWVN